MGVVTTTPTFNYAMKINVELINPVLKSLKNVFKTMLKVDAIAEKPLLKKDNIGKGHYTGIINLTGRRANASIAISFPEDVITAIAKRMLPPDTPLSLGTLADLSGELANMISGGAKTIYEANGFQLEMSLPILIIGKDHLITHRTKGVNVLIPFDSEIGHFWLEMCFEE